MKTNIYRNLRGSRIKLRPHADKLVEVVWAENGFVTCKVLKVVHDNSHKKIKELKTKWKDMLNGLKTVINWTFIWSFVHAKWTRQYFTVELSIEKSVIFKPRRWCCLLRCTRCSHYQAVIHSAEYCFFFYGCATLNWILLTTINIFSCE